MKKKVISLVLVAGLLGSVTVANAESCAGYPDLEANSKYCSAVKYVQDQGVMTGQGDGKFLPETTLSRAEAAAVLVRYLGLSNTDSRSNISKFPDADSSAWYAGYFDLLIERGIFEGYPDGTLKPANTLNKAEWLKVFYLTNGLNGSSTEKHVEDVPVQADTGWYRKYLNDAYQNNYIDLQAGKFYPANGQKRQLVADLIYRIDTFDDSYEAQEVDVPTVAPVADVGASRFGAVDAHLTKEASYDLKFGWNYPSKNFLVWDENLATPNYDQADELVKASQGLGKTVVGRFGFNGSFSEANRNRYLKYVEATVERYDKDGEADMPGLIEPISVWQFDDDVIAAADFVQLMEVTYKGVKKIDANGIVLQGVQHNLNEASKSFWQQVYALNGEDYVDAVMVKAASFQDFGVGEYMKLLSSELKSKPLWVLNAELKDAESLFKSVVIAFGAGADKLIFGQLDTTASGQSEFARNGDRFESFFVVEALIDYLNYFRSLSSQSSDVWEFSVGGKTLFAILNNKVPSGLSSNYNGVDYLGNELNLDSFLKNTLVW